MLKLLALFLAGLMVVYLWQQLILAKNGLPTWWRVQQEVWQLQEHVNDLQQQTQITEQALLHLHPHGGSAFHQQHAILKHTMYAPPGAVLILVDEQP